MSDGGAFIRFSRDKRGYEHFYLVQNSRRGKSHARILYWFRTPPNVKVGREPFDETVRRAIEARYPDVAFDWKALLDINIPPAEVEQWRERRRLERAERAAAKTRTVDVAAEKQEQTAPDEPRGFTPEAGETAEQEAGPAQESSPGPQQPQQPHKRRRRRGRRHKGSGTGAPAEAPTPSSNPPDAGESGEA